VRTLLGSLVSLPFLAMPRPLRRRMIRIALHAVSRGAPQRALRDLVQLDANLSGLIDETAMRYEGGVHPKHRLMRYHDFFVERVKPGERVLDVGCGYGAVAYSVATRAQAIVIGIDLDPANVAEARRRFAHPNLTFLVGDATRELPSGAFDVVLASNVIEHVEHRVEFYHAVQARARPGRWLVRVPMIDRDWRVPLRRELGLFHFSDPTHHTEYTRESFDAEVHHAGLVVVHLQINWGEIWAELRADA
jgi:2-polyprenyl-3-methyl-5-hydroxy-6-metoxy-1,4-benzoquinol methylase